MINAYIAEAGQAEVNQQLSSMGFSSVAAYLDYEANEAFANRTNGYSFATDGTALFLAQALPANKGSNEFSGQTYYGLTSDWVDGESIRIKDETRKYVFTASGYTFTSPWETITGSYAYDSNSKVVWLSRETIDGKNRSEYYADQTVRSGHHYPDDNAYRAVQTNRTFYVSEQPYNSTNKTIGWED